MDPFIHKMQFGFRRKRSTADAVAIVRRIAQIAESITERHEPNKIQLVFLDWERHLTRLVIKP